MFEMIAALTGLATSAFGAYEKYEGAQSMTNIQTQMIGTEEQQNAVRRAAMETAYRRNSLENARQVQKAQALGLENTTKGGAEFGSALGGTMGTIGGEGSTNARTLSQGLQSGEQMFNLEDILNKQKIAYAQAGGQVNFGSALGSLGAGISQSLPTLKNLGGQFGSLFSGSGGGFGK